MRALDKEWQKIKWCHIIRIAKVERHRGDPVMPLGLFMLICKAFAYIITRYEKMHEILLRCGKL